MTREETIALWQKSEDAKKAAVADGKTSEAAHEAAKTIWNGWAQELLRKRKTLEGKGVWASRIEHDETSYMTREVGLNPASQDWIAEASVNFSKLNFIPSAADFKLDDTEFLRRLANYPRAMVISIKFFRCRDHWERAGFWGLFISQ